MLTPRSSVHILTFFLVGFLVYANSLNSGFHFDDNITIINNATIRHPGNLEFLWTTYCTRVLTGLTFAFNYAWGGLDVFGYHLVNTLLHILNAALVYALVRLITATVSPGRTDEKNCAVAFLAGLIFLVHPVQTQAVVYITQRAAVLATFFYLATLAMYLRSRLSGNVLWRWGAFVTMVLGMFTKELTVTIPIMLVIMEALFLGGRGEGWRRRAKLLMPFLLGLAIIPLALITEQRSSLLFLRDQVVNSGPRWEYFLTQANVLRTYMRLLVFPVNQNLDYDYPIVQNMWEPGLLGSLFLILALAGVGLWGLRRGDAAGRWTAFCVAWFFLGVSVELAACAWIGRDLIFEHYIYLSSAAFAMALAWLWRVAIKSPKARRLTAAGLLLVLGVLTVERNKIWRDDFTLWNDVARKAPLKHRAYTNLGVAYRRIGEYDKAILYHYYALSLGRMDDRSKAQVYVNLGAAWGYKKEYEKEIAYCREAVKLDPYNAQAYSNMGVGYSLLKDYENAVKFAEKAVALAPNSPEYLNNLGIAHGMKGDFARALQYFTRAVAMDPSFPPARENREKMRQTLGL